MSNSGYYVVLANNGKKTAFCFDDKRDFEGWYVMFKDREKIIEQGITAKRAIELSDCIDKESRFSELILQDSQF